MKVVCAWCQKAGNFVVLREKEPPGDEISHGICDEHVRAILAEARLSPRMISGRLAAGWRIERIGGRA
jgi:hypothetical protein